jgi:hypothetical protein
VSEHSELDEARPDKPQPDEVRPEHLAEGTERDRPDEVGPAQRSGEAMARPGMPAGDPSEAEDLPVPDVIHAADEGPGSDPASEAGSAQRDAGPGGSWQEMADTAIEDAGPGGRPPRARSH